MKLWFKLRHLFARRRLEREMAEEMQAHLDGLTARHVARGMSAAEAHQAAQREFGGMDQIKERARDERRWLWLDGVIRDVRISCRGLRRSPAFSVAVVATLALCIGANSTILTALYGLVIKPLPFPDAGQIVEVYNTQPRTGEPKRNVGLAQYLDYKDNADSLADVALWRGWMFNIGEDGGTARHVGMQVTADYFAVLGLKPILGRFFSEDASLPGQGKLAVLTQSFWEDNFHADPDIVGSEVRLSGSSYTIIGVLPRSFERLSVAPRLLVPYEIRSDQAGQQWRLAAMANMYARIKPGVDHATALAQLQTLEDRFRETVADPGLRDFILRTGQRMALEQLRAEQTKPLKTGLLLLQGCALVVLLLGCVNVASLMLARANARRSELAVRQALGAGHLVIARQLLIEAALLALAGAGLGLLLTASSLRIINVYLDRIVYGIPPVSIDAGMLGLTLMIAFLVALSISLLPVLQIGRSDFLQIGIKRGHGGTSRTTAMRLVSSGLVTTQIALALVLLIGAGLLIRSFANVMATDPGFAVDDTLHVRVAYDAHTANPATLKNLQDRILEKMREIPGVESVAYSSYQPGHEAIGNPVPLPIFGTPPDQGSTYPTARLFWVPPDYFSTMGIRVLEGRGFTAADQSPGTQTALVVDQKFADRYFADRSPIGQRFAIGPHAQDPSQAPMIVGVVGVARVDGLEDRDTPPYVYSVLDTARGGLSIELRTRRSFADIMPLIRAGLREVAPTLPIYNETTMRDQLDNKAADRRGIMWMLGAYAGIALILAAVGLYGMLAYEVSQRTKEIGIRGAIGATRRQIVSLILGQGLLKAGIGLVIGLGGSLMLSRFLASLLYDVEPRDPLVFAGVTALLIGVALLASWLPARRAAKVDPMAALRCE